MKMKGFLLTFFIVLLSLHSLSFSTDIIKFKSLSQRDGLSQGSITDILQDRQGFLWFGTLSGLNRYDGYQFTVFRHDPNLHHTISSDIITELYEDVKGDIWIGTENGLNRYRLSKGTIMQLLADGSDNGLSHNAVTAICGDRQGVIWVGTALGLNRIDSASRKNRQFFMKDGKNSINHNRISALLYDNKGSLWIGTMGGGLTLHNPELNQFTHLKSKSDNALNYITALIDDSHDKLWIGTAFGGLYHFNKSSGQFKNHRQDSNNRHSISDNRINDLFLGRDRVLWIATQNGLNRFSPTDHRFRAYKRNIAEPHSISFDVVTTVFIDHSNSLWVGTRGRGLNKYSKHEHIFKTFKPEAKNPHSLNNSFVYPILEDRHQRLWIGTQGGGINRISRDRSHYQFYKNSAGDINSISSDFITGIYEDRDGTIWVGAGNGLNRFDEKTGQFSRIPISFFTPGNIHSFLEINSAPGAIWLGGDNRGLVKFEKSTGRFLFLGRSRFPELNSNAIYDLYEAPSRPGLIWISTNRGLNCYNTKSSQMIRYGKDSDPVNTIFLQEILEYSKRPGILWIGTMGRGLIQFDMDKGNISKIFTVKDGLPNNVVYCIQEDRSGSLWMSTNRGISKLDMSRMQFLNYGEVDGLQGVEFNGGSAYKSRSGEMFFGGTNGFNAFYPDKIASNTRPPKVFITDFKVFGKSIQIGESTILSRDISETKTIKLPYYKNTIAFSFVALNYIAPSKNRYAYRLMPLDRKWHHVDSTIREANYMNLPPGKYRFRVLGSNNDKVWSEEPAEIMILITPPFWSLWSFRISMISMILLVSLLLYRRRMNHMSHRLRMETELNAAKEAQMSIMPQSDPDLPGYDIAGTCIPAREAGGDFYDYFWLDEEKSIFGIAVGDVSGRALNAAMTAIMTDGILLSSVAKFNSIQEIMEKINRPIYLKTDRSVYTSICLLSLDLNGRKLSFSNAGLNDPLIKSGNGISVLKNLGNKLPLGIKQNCSYQVNETQLNSGDVVLLYTDGLTATFNSRNDIFGKKGLIDLFDRIDTVKRSSKEIVQTLISEIRQFSENRELEDDMTLLVIKVC